MGTPDFLATVPSTVHTISRKKIWLREGSMTWLEKRIIDAQVRVSVHHFADCCFGGVERFHKEFDCGISV